MRLEGLVVGSVLLGTLGCGEEPGLYDYEAYEGAPAEEVAEEPNQVCLAIGSSRMVCSGYSEFFGPEWECASYVHTLSRCYDFFESGTDCSYGCCTSYSFWGHTMLEAESCAEAKELLEAS